LRGTAVDVVLDVGFFHDWMGRLARSIEENCDELTRLDAAIGDADHGINMLRVFRVTGSRLVAVVGGAAGPLYGSAFRAAAEALGPKPEITVPELARALRAGVKAVQRIGAAEPGDKTMVDAWLPAVEALESAASGSVRSAAAAAEAAAREGMLATIPMRARKGRASYLGWRSEGHQDPGATSTRLLFAALVDATR
jgi:dihydroxyacetone kinase-like protein